MRRLVVLALALCSCEQTDPSAAKSAGGAAAAADGSVAPAQNVAPGDGSVAPAEAKGSTQSGREDAIEIYGAGAQAASPRDAASGLPTGKRQHKPVSVTKPIDK